MKRHIPIAIIALAGLAPLAAQTVPQGWKQRIDRSTSASDPDASGIVKFVTQEGGFHATNPQAATYWNPANTASRSYTLKGTFTLMQPSGHLNFYGLVFGGTNLELQSRHTCISWWRRMAHGSLRNERAPWPPTSRRELRTTRYRSPTAAVSPLTR